MTGGSYELSRRLARLVTLDTLRTDAACCRGAGGPRMGRADGPAVRSQVCRAPARGSHHRRRKRSVMSMSGSQDDLRPDLHGLPLLAARFAWVMVALVALAIVFLSLPALYAQFTTHCREAAGVCLERGQLTPEYAQTFREAGIPPRSYAILM